MGNFDATTTVQTAIGQYINLYSEYYNGSIWFDVYIIINEPNGELDTETLNKIENVAKVALNLSVDMLEDKIEAIESLEKALLESELIPERFQLVFSHWFLP